MRYILYIITFLLSTQAFGQGTWNRQAVNNKINRSQSDSVAIMPRDTAATNEVINPATGQPVGDSGRIAYMFGKFWGHNATGWSEFGGGAGGAVPSSRFINTTSPLLGGGDLSADRTLSIQDAAADDLTKGAASFISTDFNSVSGLISIDYPNAQSASGSNKGFLTAADWVAFDAKAPGSGSANYVQINPASPPQSGGFNVGGTGNMHSMATNAGTLLNGISHYQLKSGAGLVRWAIGMKGLESGSNTGSNFYISSLADNGSTLIGTPFNIDRATGDIGINTNLTGAKLYVNGNVKITDGTQAAGAFFKSDATGLGEWVVSYVTPDDFGAVGDGIVNDAAAMQSAVSSGKPVYIPIGKIYLVNTTVTCPDGTVVFGNRFGSVIKSTANQVIFQVQGNYCTFKNIKFLGDGKATGNTTQRAISMISNRSKNLIDGCIFSQLGGAGVYINSIADYKGNLISNCVADSCHTGYLFDNAGEYTTIVNSYGYGNTYGIRNFAGNNQITGGNFSQNDTAIVMGPGVGNSGHSTITGVAINHNIGASLVARNIPIGHTINGSMFYDGDIIIDGCTGFKFVGCDFSVDNISVINSSAGCFFYNNRIRGVDPVLNFSANSQVYWDNNFNEVTTNQAPANVTITGATTLTPAHKNIYVSTGSSFTITLPAASTCAGKEYYIKKISNNLNTATIDPNASETIDGFSTFSLTSYLSWFVIKSTGTGWLIVGNGTTEKAIRTVTTNTTLNNDDRTILVNNSGTVTISLPAAASNTGVKYTVKKISAAANDVIIDPNASETIDADPTKTLTLQYSSITIESNGANWHVISSHADATTL